MHTSIPTYTRALAHTRMHEGHGGKHAGAGRLGNAVHAVLVERGAAHTVPVEPGLQCTACCSQGREAGVGG